MTVDDALGWMRGGWKQSPYAKTIDGKLGIDVDGKFGFQCKDWVNAYASFVGDPFTSGNAIILWLLDQPGWTKKTLPVPGSVFVKNYVAADGINYGHTGTVDEVVDGGFYSYDQNVGPSSSLTKGVPPQRVFHRNIEMLGFLVNNKLGGGNDMTEQEAYAVVAEIYRGVTDVDPEGGQADYWAKRIMADPATAAELAKALYGEYKGDPNFRYYGRHYSEDMVTAKKQAYADGVAAAGGEAKLLEPGKYIVE